MGDEGNTVSEMCIICLSTLKSIEAIWSCGQCYCVFHLSCIHSWAHDSQHTRSRALSTTLFPNQAQLWSCPKCRRDYSTIPTHYMCFCGKLVSTCILYSTLATTPLHRWTLHLMHGFLLTLVEKCVIGGRSTVHTLAPHCATQVPFLCTFVCGVYACCVCVVCMLAVCVWCLCLLCVCGVYACCVCVCVCVSMLAVCVCVSMLAVCVCLCLLCVCVWCLSCCVCVVSMLAVCVVSILAACVCVVSMLAVCVWCLCLLCVCVVSMLAVCVVSMLAVCVVSMLVCV